MALAIRLVGLVLVGAVTMSCTASKAAPPVATGDEDSRRTGVQSVLFASTTSTQAPHDAVLPLVFAVTAKGKGHDAVLFFGGDGVLLMKDSVAADVKAVGQPAAGELLQKAIALGIPIRI